MATRKRRTKIALWKKIILLLLGLIVLGFLALMATNYYHYRQNKSPYRTFITPRIEMGVINLQNITGNVTKMTAKMLIHNPLPAKLRADSLEYKFYVSNVEVMKSTYAKSVEIARWDSTWITLPVTIKKSDLINVLDKEDRRGKDSVEYRLETNFYTKLPFKTKLKISTKRYLPLFYIPDMVVEKVTYDDFTLKGITMELHIAVENKNKFPFKMEDLAYDFELVDHPVVKGVKGGITTIRPQDVTRFVLPLRIKFGGLFDSIGHLITKGGKTDYNLAISFKVVSESNAIENSTMVIHDKGSLKEIRQVMKEAKAKGKAKKR